MSTATAHWSLDTLVGSLGRSGWGPLTEQIRGTRTVLKALADVLPHGSAHGRSTFKQLARVAAMSTRWTRHCLALLEQLGAIKWERGWRGVAGRFTVYKHVLAAWIRDARAEREHQNPTPTPNKAVRARPTPPESSPTQTSNTIVEVSSPLTLTGEVTAVACGVPPGHHASPRGCEQPYRAPTSGAPPNAVDPGATQDVGLWAAAARAAIKKAKRW